MSQSSRSIVTVSMVYSVAIIVLAQQLFSPLIAWMRHVVGKEETKSVRNDAPVTRQNSRAT